MAKQPKINLKAQPSKGKGKSEKEVTLIIQGELTLDNSEQLKNFLLENLDKYNHFVLKVNGVESIDLGAIQLIQRFIWDIKQQNKSFEAEIKIPEDYKLLFARAGLNSFLSMVN